MQKRKRLDPALEPATQLYYAMWVDQRLTNNVKDPILDALDYYKTPAYWCQVVVQLQLRRGVDAET